MPTPTVSDDIHCPVCGYYCLGHGGLGCIDKPFMIPPEIVSSTSSAPADLSFTPLQGAPPSIRPTVSLHSLAADERAIAKLLETLLNRAGFSINEAARRMGVTPNAVRQYIRGRRHKPSLAWFLRLASLCNAKVSIEFPDK